MLTFPKVVKFYTVLFGLFIFIFGQSAKPESITALNTNEPAPVTLNDRDFCRTALNLFRLGSLGINENPIEDLKAKFGIAIYSNQLERGLFQFETDILDLFLVAPELRNIDEFKRKWDLNDEQALDVLTYYGTQVFYGDIKVVSEPTVVFERLRILSREYWLSTRPELAERESYYRKNIMLLSVPEMAQELGLTEGQIYYELSRLEISILKTYEASGVLGQALRFLDSGVPLELAAREMEVGEQALRFISHHVRSTTRKVDWDRVLIFQNQRMLEVEVLLLLYVNKYSPSEIANILNVVTNTPVDSPEVRTEASVRSKMRELGLTQVRELWGVKELYLPDYGLLKHNGRLIAANAIKFIFDHYQRSDQWLADFFEIDLKSLKEFYLRHHIVRLKARDEAFTIQSGEELAQVLDRYELQKLSIDRIVDWVIQNKRLPQTRDFGADEGKVHLPRRKSQSSVFNLFPTVADVYIAVKKRAAEKGYEVSLLNVNLHIKNITPAFRAERKIEAAKLIVKWIKAHNGQVPGVEEFRRGNDLGIVKERFMGTGQYKGINGIFDNPSEAWLAVKKEAVRQGVKFRLIDLHFEYEPSLEFAEEKRKETMDAFLIWVRNQGRIPKSEEWVTGGMPRYDRLFNKQRDNHFPIFSSREELFSAMRGSIAGDPLIDLDLRQKLMASIDAKEQRVANMMRRSKMPKEEMQREAVDLVIRFYFENRCWPVNYDFGSGPGKVGIPYNRFSGAVARINGKVIGRPIFATVVDAWIAVKAAAKSRGLELGLIDRNIPSTFLNEEKVRKEIQDEAVDRVIKWSEKNEFKFPKADDFGQSEGKVGVHYGRLVANADYHPVTGRQKTHIFTSRDEAFRAVKTEAARRGHVFRE